MNFTIGFIVLNSSDLTNPIIPTSKDSKNSTHAKNIMKMSNNVISIMQSDVDSRVG